MKAKDGMKILLSLRLLTKNWVSRESLFGHVGNILFVLPVLTIVTFVLLRSRKMAVCLAAVMLLLGGFCMPAVAGPTLEPDGLAHSPRPFGARRRCVGLGRRRSSL